MGKEKVTELFGSMVFNEEVMKQRLSTTCYRAWKKCVDEGTPLSLAERYVRYMIMATALSLLQQTGFLLLMLF